MAELTRKQIASLVAQRPVVDRKVFKASTAYLMLLFVANENPALERLQELFDDTELARGSAYRALVEGLGGFFEEEPGLSGGGSLLEMLLAPGRSSPTSLDTAGTSSRTRV